MAALYRTLAVNSLGWALIISVLSLSSFILLSQLGGWLHGRSFEAGEDRLNSGTLLEMRP